MKRILVLGMNDSLWLRTYLNNVFGRSDEKYEIIVFGVYDQALFDLCSKRGYTFIYPAPVPKKIMTIPVIRGLVYRINYYHRVLQIRRKYRLDTIHIHYVEKAKLKAIKLLRNKTGKIVCTYWGSDLLRKSQSALNEEKKYLRYIDEFTFATKEMQSFFCEKYGDDYYDKSIIVRFGIDTLDEIDKLIGEKKACKKRFDFPEDKLILTVGYNGSRSQQHLKVFEVINSFPESARKKICVVVPMQYGNEADYKTEVETYLESAGFESRIIYEYTNTRETAALRMASDCFIHSQVSDAFSASVQEYLYAEKIVFNPSWLSYSIIKDEGGFYHEYSSFEALGAMLYEYILDPCEERNLNKLHLNHEIIKNLSSWKVQKDRWEQLYR